MVNFLLFFTIFFVDVVFGAAAGSKFSTIRTATGTGSFSSLIVTQYVSELCFTEYGTVSTTRPLPQKTITKLTRSHANLTSTITPTSTPDVFNTTITEMTTEYTTTTLAATTDIFSTTTTITSMETQTTTSTSTSTYTQSTTITSVLGTTQTVSTPAGYTPIASEAAVVADGGGSNAKRAIRSAIRPLQSFPTSKVCTKSVLYMTLTVHLSTATSTVTLPQQTSTMTSTSTTTSTITTSSADFSSTTTVYATTYSTSSITTTSTTVTVVETTSTTYTPAPTIYAICQDPSNYIDEINNTPIDVARFVYTAANQAPIFSPQECCNLCQAMANCGSSAWLPYTGNACYFFQFNNTQLACSPETYTGLLEYGGGVNPGVSYTVSNGQCGQFYVYGDDA